MSTTAPKKTIAFFGASGGCGFAALQRAVVAGHTCITLCRTPSKLTDKLPADKYPNLVVEQGNAHDTAAVARCLVDPSDDSRPRLVDAVVFSIGGVFNIKCMTIDDPHVCEKGIGALLEALGTLRSSGMQSSGVGGGGGGGSDGKGPKLVIVSTCGISKTGRDFPILLSPVYHGMLRVPHADKRILEEKVTGSGELYTFVRPSLLADGEGRPDRPIRVGVEDCATGAVRREIGYNISRDDVGRWIFENLIEKEGREYLGKAAWITW